MKTYIAIADEDGASVLTTIAGTTCPRCGTPVQPSIPHKCGDQVAAQIQTTLEGLAQQAAAYPD